MDVDVRQYGPTDPDRPLDWRFQVASQAVRTGRLPSLHSDNAVTALYQYLRRAQPSRNPVARRQLADQCAHLDRAVRIYHSPSRATRYHLEALLVTGSPVSTIAAATGIAPDVVRWYERVFCDVWTRLDRPDFIADVIFGRVGVEERDWRDIAWKAAGYFGGLEMLTMVVGLQRGGGLDQLAEALFAERRILLMHRVTSAARQPGHIGQDIFRQLVKTGLASADYTADAQSRCEQLETNVQKLLEEVIFYAIGRPDLKDLPEHDTWAAELRTEELFDVALGRPLEKRDEISGLRIPEVDEIPPLE